MKIIFVRHGKDDDRFRGGWSQRDLLPEGQMQAKRLATHLAENQDIYRIGTIVSSDLKRAMSTAEILADALGLSVTPDARLREANNGDLAGMRHDEALERYPGLFWNALDMDECYPNGESPRAFYVRVKAWFETFADTHRDWKQNVLVVTHGGVINVVYHLIKGRAWSNRTPAFKAASASLHILDIDAMRFEVENRMT